MTAPHPLNPVQRGPQPAAAERDEPATVEPLDRYKAALRDRFPSPEEIYRQADRRRRNGKAGATVAALAALATGLWIADPVYRSEAYATAIGETRTHALADGSTVVLNTGSALDVEWRLRSRRLHLGRGEAMFRVAHGMREFTVHTPGAGVRDIGTAFNVRVDGLARTPGATVTVVEGAVEVRGGAEAAVLTAGQTAFADTSGVGVARAADLGPLTAWQRGRLVFDGTPLDRAVEEMRRYHTASIVLDMPDGPAADLRLSGEFDHQRIDTLLELLPTILPVRVRRLPDGQAVISAQIARGAEKTWNR